MSDGRKPENTPRPRESSEPLEPGTPEEESAGSITPDPELEAALRDAAEAVPDDASSSPQRGEDGGEARPTSAAESGEVLLEEPLEEGPPELQIQRLRQQLADSNDRLIRLQADFENFRKRAFRDRQDALNYGHQNFVKDLLSVVDNLDRAIAHARQSEGAGLENFLQGVELVRRELLGVFEKHHVTEIDALGKPFDPALHEAMAQVVDETAPANTVVEVLEKGYQLRDRLVRPSRVVVAKAPEEPGDRGGGEAAG